MYLDVIDLHSFYYCTPLGDIVQNILRRRVVDLWYNTKGQTVVGYGFAMPVLDPFIKKSRRVMCLMAAQQGVMAWPKGSNNRSVLVEETSWPIATGHIDKLIVLHGLEVSNAIHDLLDEIWRVLGPGGKALFIVPNRSGLWARLDKTPFGYGHPYSIRQLEARLKQHRFVPERYFSALYFAPSNRSFWHRMALYWENLANHAALRNILPFVAGVVMIEARKKIYEQPKIGLSKAVRRPLRILEGISKPKEEPVAGRNCKI